MENLKHRKGAKIVAITNLVLSSFALTLLALVAGYLLIVLAGAASASKDPVVDEHVQMFATIGGLALVIGICFVILELVAAQKLLQSTQLGLSFAEASKLARFWQNVALVLVVLSILGALTGGHRSGGGGLLILILRILGLFIVHNYIKELELANLQQMSHVVYAVTPGEGGFNAQPGQSVMVNMMVDPQSGNQAGFVYPSNVYPNLHAYSDPCPKYADVVGNKQ